MIDIIEERNEKKYSQKIVILINVFELIIYVKYQWEYNIYN